MKIKKSIKASKKLNKFTVKASKSAKKTPIMAGAGGGLTIEISSIDFGDIRISDLTANSDGTYDLKKLNGTISIKSIGTYYDGGVCDVDDIPVAITLQNIDVSELLDNPSEFIENDTDESIDVLYDLINSVTEDTINYGGGWSHVTFKGDIDTKVYASWCEADLFIDILDEDTISALDRFAHGENVEDGYSVYVGDYPTDRFESESAAIEYAIQRWNERGNETEYDIDDVTVVHDIFTYDFWGDNIKDIQDLETVWSAKEEFGD